MKTFYPVIPDLIRDPEIRWILKQVQDDIMVVL